ncbi:MAG TPA: hypothetical protein VJU84_03345 [Pyrinomonadaceae bacterium]|nr:hypothetical protein [Pyrinomonadaceae bacterium]
MKSLAVVATLVLLLLPSGNFSSPVSTIQEQVSSDESSMVKVVSYKWSRDRQQVEQATPMLNAPVAAVSSLNKNFERNRRANVSPGERDPNLDTVDGRAAALERSVQSARAPKPIEGFAYRAKFQNVTNKELEIIFWEYEFTDGVDTPVVSRRQFLCAGVTKAGKEKEFKGFTLSGPSDVVAVESLGKKTESPLKERVIINRLEFTDGTIWQRKGWHLNDVKTSIQRALSSPWAPDMCKAL